MTICDMCKKNYGQERLTDTGYFTAGEDVYHLCMACSQKIKELIASEELKYINECEVSKPVIVDLSEDKRKLNDVFTVPRSRGYITIKGIIGSGKAKEEVLLKAKSSIGSTDFINWRHRIGEQWKVVEHFTESE